MMPNRLLITGHEILHVKRLLSLPLATQANGRRGEQDGGQQRQADATPRDHVRPVVPNAGVISQYLVYTGLLRVSVCAYLFHLCV